MGGARRLYGRKVSAVTTRRRWPDGAEQHRQDAIESVREARRLIRELRRHIKTNPGLAELMAADAETQLADAERLLEVAKHGR
jgi:hypothetical protein